MQNMIFPAKLNKGWYVVIIVALFLTIIVSILYVLTRTWGPECFKFNESTGWIGDTIGGITAPFIGLVNILLLIWTLHKQIEFNEDQLKTQRNEQFKAAFFQMLQTQRELLHEVNGTFLSRNMKGNVLGGKVSGLDYFHDAGLELKTLFDVLEGNLNDGLIISNIRNKYGITDELLSDFSNSDNEKQMAIAYRIFFDGHFELGHYCRHLYHILKFISNEKKDAICGISDDQEKSDIKKRYKGYADLLQATLSAEELRIAYYNCAAFENAKKLFIEFQFVENLTKNNLIRPDTDSIIGLEIKDTY